MKKYTTPEVEIIEVNSTDIIQTSWVNGGTGSDSGDSDIFSIDLGE